MRDRDDRAAARRRRSASRRARRLPSPLRRGSRSSGLDTPSASRQRLLRSNASPSASTVAALDRAERRPRRRRATSSKSALVASRDRPPTARGNPPTAAPVLRASSPARDHECAAARPTRTGVTVGGSPRTKRMHVAERGGRGVDARRRAVEDPLERRRLREASSRRRAIGRRPRPWRAAPRPRAPPSCRARVPPASPSARGRPTRDGASPMSSAASATRRRAARRRQAPRDANGARRQRRRVASMPSGIPRRERRPAVDDRVLAEEDDLAPGAAVGGRVHQLRVSSVRRSSRARSIFTSPASISRCRRTSASSHARPPRATPRARGAPCDPSGCPRSRARASRPCSTRGRPRP